MPKAFVQSFTQRERMLNMFLCLNVLIALYPYSKPPTPATPAQPVPLHAKNPYPCTGVGVLKGWGYGLSSDTPGLPLSFSSREYCYVLIMKSQGIT
jgi:hypothetical protein